MMGLFSTTEPKMDKPSSSLKESLLKKEKETLAQIQSEAQKLLGLVSSLLKKTQQNHKRSTVSDLKHTVTNLHSQLTLHNYEFQKAIVDRDDLKAQKQQLFKSSLKSYEKKKTELNNTIEKLEKTVQNLEDLGKKTQVASPQPNSILSQFKKQSVEKIFEKLELEKAFLSHQQITSLIDQNSLEIQLRDFQGLVQIAQNVLYAEQIKSSRIDKDIACQNLKFEQLALKQQMFKHGLKESLKQNSRKRQTTIKDEISIGYHKTEKKHIEDKTQLDQKNCKQVQNAEKQEVENKEQQNQGDFMEACLSLITQRFVEQ